MSEVRLSKPLAELRQKAQKTHMAGDRAAARPLYEAYLGSVPVDATMWTNLGALLRADGMPDMALRAQKRAFAIEPAADTIRNNLANILADTGDATEALALRRGLLAEKPDDPNLKAMVGKVLRTLRRHDEGIKLLKEAQAAHPDYVEIVIQLALTQLAGGHYAEGFKNFERRWETDELTPRNMTEPKWDGGSLEGKSIMVLPEQGFGDCLAMTRFLPALRAYNPARVMLAVERPLHRLFEGLAGVDWIGSSLDDGDSFDVWTNIMDLPTLHFQDTAQVPAPPALNVPQASRDRADQILAPYARTLNIGVVWTGSLTYRGNAVRSFEHTEYHRLMDVPGVQLFSLYKGPKLEAFHADGTGHFILDTGATESDFGDTAAMMQKLDLVVTSDTATAHLAGTLGVPVWTLLHWDAFWMWQLENDSSPWYPSMRLFRQEVPRDWSHPFEKIRQAIARMAKDKGA